MTAASDQVAPAIELIDVGKSYGKVPILSSINLAIAPGEFIALLGPSGCGKSTLLKLIAGLEELSEGEIKPAVLICSGAKDRNTAQALLAASQGNLRRALERLVAS